jgi:hypothetical protein
MASATVTLGSITFRAASAAADADGDRFTVRDLPGWTGAPVELVTVDKPLSAGAVIAHGRYKGRSLSIVGHAIASSEATVWRVRNKLEACITPGTDATLTVAEPSPGSSKTLTVRLADGLRVKPVGPRTVEFEIPLFAANPTKT